MSHPKIAVRHQGVIKGLDLDIIEEVGRPVVARVAEWPVASTIGYHVPGGGIKLTS